MFILDWDRTKSDLGLTSAASASARSAVRVLLEGKDPSPGSASRSDAARLLCDLYRGALIRYLSESKGICEESANDLVNGFFADLIATSGDTKRNELAKYESWAEKERSGEAAASPQTIVIEGRERKGQFRYWLLQQIDKRAERFLRSPKPKEQQSRERRKVRRFGELARGGAPNADQGGLDSILEAAVARTRGAAPSPAAQWRRVQGTLHRVARTRESAGSAVEHFDADLAKDTVRAVVESLLRQMEEAGDPAGPIILKGLLEAENPKRPGVDELARRTGKAKRTVELRLHEIRASFRAVLQEVVARGPSIVAPGATPDDILLELLNLLGRD